MKNKIICLLVIVLAITTVQAQDPQRKMRQQFVQSEEQQKKLKALQEDYRKNLMDLRKKDDITVKEWRNRMADLQKKHRDNMQSFLPPEQKERTGRMKMQRNRMADINARTRMNRLNMQLNHGLNENLYRLRHRMHGQMKSLREHPSMEMQKRRGEIRSLIERRNRIMTRPIPMYEPKRRMEQMRMYHLHKPGKLS